MSIKVRPVVIIDNDDDYEVSGELLVIFISTKCSSPCPYYHIKIHDSDKFDAGTGLSKPSWAKCNIYRHLKLARIKNHREHA